MTVPLGILPVILGRSETSGIFLPDKRISRQHGKVFHKDGSWFLEDFGSTNGILVNGDRITTHRLNHGDIIVVGPFVLHFLEGEIEEAPLFTYNPEEMTTLMVSPEGSDPEARLLYTLWELASVMDSFGTTGEVLRRFRDVIIPLFAPTAALFSMGSENAQYLGEGAGCSMEDVLAHVAARVLPRVHKERLGIIHSRPTTDGARVQYLCVPMILDGAVHGTLYLERETLPGFNQKDLHLLSIIGRLIIAAVAGSNRFAMLSIENSIMEERYGKVGGIIGESEATRELLRTITKTLGPVDATVLLTGETGTGKTLVAEAIHKASARAGKPFIKINCAAIPKSLIESELFGYERGAFTGATTRKIGLFETANHGTLFLDEIGELDLGSQAKLLSILQDKKLQRIAGRESIDLDVRIIAATNKDLQAEVAGGAFRSDLFYRLNVVTIELLPLRQRREDIIPLTLHFLKRFREDLGRHVESISTEVLSAFEHYPWPGNIRELSNTIERAVIFATGKPELIREDFPTEFFENLLVSSPAGGAGSGGSVEVAQADEEEMVRNALALAGGNRRKAARILGWYPQKLYARLKRFNIS